LKVTQEIKYLLNYKPLLNYKKDIKDTNSIYCKNFFLFFLLLEKFTNKGSYAKNNSLTIKKKNKYLQSFLRAPNRYKKAQVKIELIRYEVTFKVSYYYNLTFIKNFDILYFLYFIKFFFYFFLFFESTLFFLRKKTIKLKLNSSYSNNCVFEL
jgi:hypothetical protein